MVLANNQKYICPVLSVLTPSVQKTTSNITVANVIKLQATAKENASFNNLGLNLVVNAFGVILSTSMSSIIRFKKRCLTNIKIVKLKSK